MYHATPKHVLLKRPDHMQLCSSIGSTGLYPYAASSSESNTFDARQFPKSSGYPEDPGAIHLSIQDRPVPYALMFITARWHLCHHCWCRGRSKRNSFSAATGIAAAALAFGLVASESVKDCSQPICIRQGWAMGKPSEILVHLFRGSSGKLDGCWLSGNICLERDSKTS